ncbi:MAG: aminomethyl-transferring glycine dehydrogenase subunit GcvPA [Pyrinomonadaceae bacterium]|nr:aminomethyl-transferring glycine dehydrogenase subunit GcvPA [Pyrinomonadaceae bacterium]
MRYIPNSPDERAEMLRTVGLNAPEELFSSIPADIILKRQLDLPAALSEMELLARFEAIAAHNTAARRPNFLGAGAYSHYSPTIIDSLIQRSEFFTAYTPYQPEVSQGTLQVIFEFQTMVCQLTGMEVANASMYDGSTSVAEAVLMAERVTRRRKVIVSPALHPEYLQVAQTYVSHAGIELAQTGFDEQAGRTTLDDATIDEQTAAVVVQSPNFYGCVEDLESLAERTHAAGALLIVAVTECASLGLLRSPGACGADIVVAEGQSLGVPLGYGGPYLGLFATREKFARQMPGRLVGVAADKEGRRGFVLTLATREQHIRREKATSNICTNEGLIALIATIYMTTMGRRGLQEVAMQCAQKAAYAARRIAELPGFSLPYAQTPRFNEFTVRAPVDAAELLRRLAREHNITGGLALSRYDPTRANDFLACVTETNPRAEIDALVAGLKALTA